MFMGFSPLLAGRLSSILSCHSKSKTIPAHQHFMLEVDRARLGTRWMLLGRGVVVYWIAKKHHGGKKSVASMEVGAPGSKMMHTAL